MSTQPLGIIRSSHKALTVTSKNFTELREQITAAYRNRVEKLKELRIAKIKLAMYTLGHAVSFILIFGFFYKGIANTRKVQQDKVDRLKKELDTIFVEIKFADASQLEKSWLNCLDAFEGLVESHKIWDLTYAERINKVKVRTTANTAVKRTLVKYAKKSIEIIKSDIDPISIPNANGPDLFIFPTFVVLFKDNQRFGIFDLKEISGNLNFTSYHEEDKVPSDAEIIGHTWKKANRDGSRDKRFKGNYQIPIAKYGDMTLQSQDGLQESYMFSNAQAFAGFAEAFEYHLESLK